MIRIKIFSSLLLLSVGCTAITVRQEKELKYQIVPNETVVVLDRFKVTHDGYGHRITSTGDRSFFDISINDTENPTENGSLRIGLPIDANQTYEWRNLQVRILSCEDQGPPHGTDAKATFTARLIETIGQGTKHILKVGDAVAIENGPTLKLRSFGHDDDDGGGQTTVDFVISKTNITQSLMMFYSPKSPMIETWQTWKIEIHEWTEPGPPHRADESVEVSVIKN